MTSGRRLGRVVAVTGVGVLLGAVGLAAEVLWVVTREYLPASSAPPATATLSPAGATSESLRLVVLGDSTAAGIGASSTQTSIGGRAARLLMDAGGTVELRSVARSGARTADLVGQVDRALELDPDVALVIVGANDATHVTSLDAVAADGATAVRRLSAAGVQVVVGTCPDMGAARVFPHPLREIVAARGRAVARAQLRAVGAAGGRAVDLATLTGPAFRADARTLSSDRFHPSDRGYRLWARALAPALRQAVEARP